MPLVHPSPLPNLFFVEAILKVIGGSIFLISPTSILKNLTSPPYTPTSISLVRAFGTQTLAFSVPLFLAARPHAGSIVSRRVVYWAILAREGFLAAGLVGQLVCGWAQNRQSGRNWRETRQETDEKALEEGLMLEKRGEIEELMVRERKLRCGLWMWLAELSPFIVGRLWILVYRKEWFESL